MHPAALIFALISLSLTVAGCVPAESNET